MGQIKNIKLHIVTDIKSASYKKSSSQYYMLNQRTAIDEAVLDMKTRWLGRDNSHVLSTCIGSFVDTLCERMQQRVQVERGHPHKLLLYSGHDYTILPSLLALGVRVREWPPFAANIIIELYKTRKVLESTIPETGDSDTESCASDGQRLAMGNTSFGWSTMANRWFWTKI